MRVPKGGSGSQAFLAETVETGDKNRDVSQRHAAFCEEGLEKIDVKDVKLFQIGFGWAQILSLESIDYFGTREYFSEDTVYLLNNTNISPSHSLLYSTSWSSPLSSSLIKEPREYTNIRLTFYSEVQGSFADRAYIKAA